MVSQNIVNIILKMEDRASQVAQKVDQMVNKLGNTAQQSNQKASQSVEKLNINYGKTANEVSKVVTSAERVGNIGSKQFDRYNESIQKSIVNFNRLDDETQNMLRYLNQMSTKGRETFVSMSSKAQEAISKFVALENETRTWGNTIDFTKTKLSLMGNNVDSVKGKVQVLGSSFISYVSPKIDTLSNSIKSKLSSALSTVKTKIHSLGDAFTGVGGVISSVFGGIGLAAMGNMTLGASIARERIQSLSFATMGFGQSMEQFVDKEQGLFGIMDDLTNKSLVSLDQLAQSASVVRMGTGASKEQMQTLIPILNDIGQRAILMGKSGDEAMGLMQAAGKGLNGEFEMLRENFGITKDKLKEAGWSGSADDIDGYTESLKKCLSQSGDVSNMMNTTHGKLTRLQKMWNVSARSLGDDFKPVVDQALDSVLKFVDANNDGQIDEGAKSWAKYAAGAMTATSAFVTLAPSINPVLDVLEKTWNSAVWVKDKLTNLGDTIDNMKGKWDSYKEKVNSAKDKLVEFKDKISNSWNEGKLNTIKQKFQEIKQKIIEAKGDLTNFWNKLRENATEKLDLIKDKLSIVKDKIVLAKDKLVEFLSRMKAIAAEKIAVLADKFKTLASNITLAGIKAKLYATYQWLVNAATAVWNALLDANPVMLIVIAIMALVAALIYLYNTNDTVRAAIDGLFAALSGVGEWISSSLVPAFEWLWQTLQPIGEFLMGVFAPIWNVIVQVLTIVWTTVTGINDVFNQFMAGQISLPQLLLGIWGLLNQMWVQILMTIVQAVINFAMQIWNSAVQAGTNMLNGVITYVSQLPGRFWSYLAQTTSNIISAGAQWVASARQKAGEMVNSASTTVQQLPGKIYTEFTKVPDRIREAIPAAIQAAVNFGKDIINGVLNAMGIHSPGIVQNSIAEEFKNTIQKIKDAVKPAGEYAKQVGSAIVEKFGSPKLSLDTEDLIPYQDLDANPLENVDLASMDLSSVSGGLDSALGMTDDTNTMIGESYNALATMMMTTLQGMVLQDQLAYGQMQANDLTTFQNISTGLNLNLLSMSTNLRTQLTNMLNTHKLAMNNATNTTRQQLALMLNETMKVTGEMRSAWGVMADSIISAAARIKNEATTYFNQLSSTIGTFYKKLQNPSQWGGGPGSSTVHSNRRVGYDPSVGSRITRSVANAMRVENHAPQSISGSKASRLPLAKGYLEYLNLTPSSRVSVNDLIQSGAIKEEYLGLLSGVAGWNDVVPANVNYIKGIARNWNMKGPQIPTGAGTVDTGMAFKVSEFENGTPKISFDTFEKIARALFTTVPYPAQMYFTSDRYGSWQNALAHGEMNCWDGTNCLLALANTCNFSGYMARGTWNGIPHVFPIINGKKMDTTSMQNRGNWEGVAAGNVQINIPKVMGKSTPRRDTWNPFKGLFGDNDSTEEIVNDVTHESTVEEINLNLNHNVNVTVDGNVESVDTDALIAELTESVTDKRLIDRIADALIKRDKRIARMGGI